MIAGVSDTHTALWYLYDDPRLSVAAGNFINQTAAAGMQIAVLPASAYADLKSVIAAPDHVFKEATFTVEIVDAMRRIPRAGVPDLPTG